MSEEDWTNNDLARQHWDSWYQAAKSNEKTWGRNVDPITQAILYSGDRIRQLEAEVKQLKISRDAALSRESGANRDWSTAAREWMIFRNNIFDTGEKFFPEKDWAAFCNTVDWCNTCGRSLTSCGCGPEHPESREAG